MCASETRGWRRGRVDDARCWDGDVIDDACHRRCAVVASVHGDSCAVVAIRTEDHFESAVAVQAKRVADAVVVGSLAIHVAGTLGCDR